MRTPNWSFQGVQLRLMEHVTRGLAVITMIISEQWLCKKKMSRVITLQGPFFVHWQVLVANEYRWVHKRRRSCPKQLLQLEKMMMLEVTPKTICHVRATENFEHQFVLAAQKNAINFTVHVTSDLPSYSGVPPSPLWKLHHFNHGTQKCAPIAHLGLTSFKEYTPHHRFFFQDASYSPITTVFCRCHCDWDWKIKGQKSTTKWIYLFRCWYTFLWLENVSQVTIMTVPTVR